MGSSIRRNFTDRSSSGFMKSCLERKSGFIKWLSKVFKGSQRGLQRRHLPPLDEDENKSWWRPKNSLDGESKDKEFDHQISVSLSEGTKKRKGRENEEGFSKPLKESNGIPHALPHNPSIPSRSSPRPRVYRICGGCKQVISSGSYLSSMGNFWHPKCFCCRACGHPICELEFSLSGSYSYHKSCYKELYHPKCDVCHQYIPSNLLGLIEYRAHPYWNQKYCPSHEHDRTPRCCSCERMESRNARHISLDDKRNLCLECMNYAIMNTDECQLLYQSIRDFYEEINMKIDQQIPMLLVERQALNEAMEGENDGSLMPETRGLCLSEEQTMQKKQKIGTNSILSIRRHPRKVNSFCEVTAILVLYGLPRLLTGSILAHELMHGWLRLNGYRNLRAEVEEGMCQVMSHMWLESELRMPLKKKKTSSLENMLGEFFLHQIAHDTSPAYGDGFRAAHRAVSIYGLGFTLNHIHFNGALPL